MDKEKDHKDCDCLNCKSVEMWGKDPHAQGLAQTIAEKLIPMLDVTKQASDLEDGSVIFLMNYVALDLMARAQDCYLLKIKLDKLIEDLDDEDTND